MIDEFLLNAVLLLFGARLGGYLAVRTGQSVVLGEILAGMLLGPYVFGVFSPTSPEVMDTIAQLGAIFLMFLIGFHIDFNRFRKFLKKGMLVAFFGFIFSAGGGLLLAAYFGWTITAAYILAASFAVTSVGVTYELLVEKKKNNTRAGVLVIDSAVMTDVYSVVLLGIISAMVVNANPIAAAGHNLIKISLFFAIAILIGKRLVDLAVSVGESLNLRLKEGMFSIIIMLIFLGTYLSDIIGLYSLIGAFTIGLLLEREGRKKVEKTEHEIHSMAYGFFIPIFFAFVGTNIDPFLIFKNVPALLLLFTIAVITKLAGSWAGSILAGLSRRDSLIVGLAMVPRLEIAAIITQTGLLYGLINVEQFSLLLATFSLTLLFAPAMLSFVLKK